MNKFEKITESSCKELININQKQLVDQNIKNLFIKYASYLRISKYSPAVFHLEIMRILIMPPSMHNTIFAPQTSLMTLAKSSICHFLSQPNIALLQSTLGRRST